MSKHKASIACIFLTLATLTAFWRVNECDFTNYDDDIYITANSRVRDGLSIDAVRWAFTSGYAANWHPLTWISHMADVQLFGFNPHIHHFTNLLFHVANTLLLFFVLCRMTKAFWRSLFVAALFALHPLHVESVAWVAERKDVLSTFFWMLTIAAYVRYVEHRTEDGGRKTEYGKGNSAPHHLSSVLCQPSSALRYLAVIVFFAMGLMSKPMLVTLPFVLLLLDYWPLGRMSGSGYHEALANSSIPGPRIDPAEHGTGADPQSSVAVAQATTPPAGSSLLRPLLLEKLPLFILSAISCIVTLVVQQRAGTVTSIEEIPPGVRIANASVSYFIYLGKTVWPHDLAVFYPHHGSPPVWQVLGAVLFLSLVSLAVILTAKRFPWFAVGWLWFTGTLVPVIGIVQVGGQAMADRYAYIPLIGVFIMAAWGIPELLRKWLPGRPLKIVLSASAAAVLVSLSMVTWKQAGYWKDSIALYDHALEVTTDNDVIYFNRGLVYKNAGKPMQAIADFDRAIQIYPENPEAYNNRGLVYDKLGDPVRAIADFDRAIEINPKHSKAYNNRGVAYGRLGNNGRAIWNYDRAIEIQPGYAMAFVNRGLAYGRLGDLKRAIDDYKRALEIDPNYPEACLSLGEAYGKLGDRRQELEYLQKAASLGNETAKGLLQSRGNGW